MLKNEGQAAAGSAGAGERTTDGNGDHRTGDAAGAQRGGNVVVFPRGEAVSAPALPAAHLAEAINAEHERAYGKAREALEHARRAGELLLQAKGGLKHGEWSDWLAKNLSFSPRTATRYMQVAEGWERLKSKSDTVADLTLRGALDVLAEFRKKSPTEPKSEAPVGPREVVHEHDAGGADLVDANPDTRRAFEHRYQLAALLLAWAEASPDAREQFVAMKGVEIATTFRCRELAA